MSERAEAGRDGDDVMKQYDYPDMTKTQTRGTARFVLHVESGSFTDSEIIVLLGENGTGCVREFWFHMELEFAASVVAQDQCDY